MSGKRNSRVGCKKEPVNLGGVASNFNGMAMKFPVVHFDERKAADAYLAHVALLECELRDPLLRANPAWVILRQDAFERFANAYEAV